MMSNRGFVDSDGERIYFESWGEGLETLVLAHGMGGNHAVWYQQVPALSRLYRVVTWDQRGFGKSSRDNCPIGPVPAVVDLARLLDNLGIDKAHIVGQSMGGWAALGFAIEHPGRTTSLVLADTTAGIFNDRIRGTLADYGKVIASAPTPDEWPLGFHPAVGTQLLVEDLARSFLYGQLGSLTDPPSPLEIVEVLLSTDHTGRIAEVTAPTLFVVGEYDPIFPPGLIEAASAFIAGSRVVVVPDTGHSPYFERSDQWNDIVTRFLADSTT